MKMYYVKTVHIHIQTQGVGKGKREDIANQGGRTTGSF